jgi:FtsH-binding integral membrane protein
MQQTLNEWIYNTPISIFVLVTLAMAVVLATAALLLTYAVTSADTRRRHRELSSFAVTNIAVLYAVLLAFIAVATWESFSKASELTDVESTLAGNLYRDTRGLPQPVADQIRGQIRDYLRVVIEQEWPKQRAGIVPTVGWSILNDIHQSVVSINPANAGQIVLMQEMLHGLNELYSARTSRLDAVNGHVPGMVWIVILAVGALTIAYSCFVYTDGIIGHLIMVAGLTVALTLVVALIVELDYPFRGSISVSAEPYRHVLSDLEAIGTTTAH